MSYQVQHSLIAHNFRGIESRGIHAQEGQFLQALNVHCPHGSIQCRPGIQSIPTVDQSSGNAVGLQAHLKGLFYYPILTERYLIAVYDKETETTQTLYYATYQLGVDNEWQMDRGTLDDIADKTVTFDGIAIGSPVSNPPSGTNPYVYALCLVNGIDSPRLISKTTAEMCAQTGYPVIGWTSTYWPCTADTGYLNELPAYRYVCMHYDALVFAGDPEIANSNVIQFSDAIELSLFNVDSTVFVPKHLAPKLTGIFSVGGQLHVCSPNTIVRFYGRHPVDSTWQPPELVSDGIGIIDSRTVVHANGASFFPNESGFYMMEWGGGLQKISDPIESIYEDSNRERLKNIRGLHASDYDEIWFSMPSSDSKCNDRIMAWNYRKGEWYQYDIGADGIVSVEEQGNRIYYFCRSECNYWNDPASVIDGDNDVTSVVGRGGISASYRPYLSKAGTFTLYVGFKNKSRGIAVLHQTAVAGGTYSLAATYYNGTNWTTSISPTDGTNGGSSSLEQDGDITWTPPSDWVATTVSTWPDNLYWVKFVFTATSSPTVKIGRLGAYSAIEFFYINNEEYDCYENNRVAIENDCNVVLLDNQAIKNRFPHCYISAENKGDGNLYIGYLPDKEAAYYGISGAYAKANVFKYTGSAYTDYTDSVNDSSISTYADFSSLAADDFIYIGSWLPFKSILFNMGSLSDPIANCNTNACWWEPEIYDGSSWVAVDLEDDTTGLYSSDAGPLAISGHVEIRWPSRWAKTTVNSKELFWIRFRIGTAFSATTYVHEIKLREARQQLDLSDLRSENATMLDGKKVGYAEDTAGATAVPSRQEEKRIPLNNAKGRSFALKISNRSITATQNIDSIRLGIQQTDEL